MSLDNHPSTSSTSNENPTDTTIEKQKEFAAKKYAQREVNELLHKYSIEVYEEEKGIIVNVFLLVDKIDTEEDDYTSTWQEEKIREILKQIPSLKRTGEPADNKALFIEDIISTGKFTSNYINGLHASTLSAIYNSEHTPSTAQRAVSTLQNMNSGMLEWYKNESQNLDGTPMLSDEQVKERLGNYDSGNFFAIKHRLLPMLYGAAPFVGSALSVGTVATLTGGASLWVHTITALLGGAGGLLAAGIHNNSGIGGDRLKHHRLIHAVNRFKENTYTQQTESTNNEPGVTKVIYRHTPRMSIIKNTIAKLRSKPPKLGKEITNLSRSDMNMIMHRYTDESVKTQNVWRTTGIVMGIIASLYVHNVKPALSTHPSSTAPISGNSGHSSFTSHWGAGFKDFFKFDGQHYPGFRAPSIDTLKQACLYTTA